MALSLGELATRFGCDLRGDPDVVVERVSSLSQADGRCLSFLSNARLTADLAATQAGAVVLRAEDADASPVATLIADDPYAAYARMANVLHPPPPVDAGVHSSAVVHETASVDTTSEVAAHAVLGENVVIGRRCYIGPGCIVGPDCRIADDVRLIASVTLVRRVKIGERTIIHPGVVIGADGFGNAMTPDGWVKVPQLGGVRIGADVEIGSNSTVDCGAIADTVIEDGVRIDNLCMIAHNVHVGAHTAMAAMTGIAGSTTIGKRCMFAGQSGAVGHITVCDDVVVSGQGMLTKDVTEPGVYASSFPVEPAKDWNRRVARLRRIDSLYDRVTKLEKGRR